MAVTPRKMTYARACHLVGDFMNSFAFMERALNDGIAKILGLDTLEAIIATTNMQMRAKIHIFKTLINLRGAPKDWCAHALKIAQAVSNMVDHRNTVAHVPFGVHDASDAVEFLPIKAKGKLTFPDMIWGEVRFESLNTEMEALTTEIAKITEKLVTIHSLVKADAELSSGKPPSPQTQRLLARLLQGDLDSGKAILGIGPETQPKPEVQ